MRGTKACYEHRADADISFLAKGQDRLMSACSFVYGKEYHCFLGSINSRPPNPCSRKKRYPFHGSLRFGLLAAIVEPFLQISLE